MLGGRPDEQFKVAIGILIGIVLAIPVNTLNLTNWGYPPELAYVLGALVICGILLRHRSVFVGAVGTVVCISLPQLVAAILPSPVSALHVSAGLLWISALGLLGCLYLLRAAETRTDGEIDVHWLFRPRN